ncbi:tetratricopeptide repeat protein [Kitasatospora sp. GAS1066B]|uniref:tetratricopeptide repeat protein n=1 Tax=Kitasatospora sp. GAS1066B TaxID=3156271 RepID=UPI003515840E
MSSPGADGRPADGPNARQTLRVEHGFGYAAVAADLHVFPDRGPVYQLAEYRPPSTAEDAAWLTAQPSRLLNARFEIVDFTGRAREQAELAAWRDSGDLRISATWLHGPGGQGKSRLAARFAAESAAAGWKVVTAAHGPGAVLSDRGSQDLRSTGARGLLLVVDYADRWPLSHLAWLFSNKMLDQPVPTRVLLLARSVVPWPAVRAALEDLRAESREHELRPLDEQADPGAREAMFTVARDCFATRYGLADPAVIGPPGDLQRPEFGLVLALHMAALVAVDAHVHGHRPPRDMRGLSAYLLNRERRHWTRLYENRLEGLDYQTPPSTMDQVVFTAVLTGPTTHPGGTAVLTRLGLEQPTRLLADHASCYPATTAGMVLEALYPDRLAEDFLALSLPGHGLSDHPAAPWAAATAAALIGREQDGSVPAHLTRALTFLAAAAAPDRWPHAAEHLERILRADPALAVAGGNAVLTAVAQLDLAPAVLEGINRHLPALGQVDLDAGIASFTARLTAHRLAVTGDPIEHAQLYQNLGFRMSRAGQWEEAVTVTEQAVELFRRLTTTDPGAHEADLAMALVDLSAHTFRSGRSPASRHAAEEAVGIFRRLATVDPAAYEPGLAVSLSHLSQGFSDARRAEDALAATHRAVGIFQRLAVADPAAYEPGVAMALANVGAFSWRLRRWHDALAATERAVELLRRLVVTAPTARVSGLARPLAADESDLATALANLSVFLWGNRRRTEAVSALQEATEISRRLAAATPAAHEPDHARMSLSLGTYLSRLQSWPWALAATEEAAEIYRRLAAADATEYEHSLAKALQASAWARVGGGADLRPALHAADEAVRIYQRLAAEQPTDFRDRLAAAQEAQEAVRAGIEGKPVKVSTRWTMEEHWMTLLNQDEVWQDGQDQRHRLDDMPPRYCDNVLKFILRQADALFEMLLDGLLVAPESLGWEDGDDSAAWLSRQPLVTALRRRTEGKPARSELCYCGYRIQPGWSHEYCYPGIIVD